MKRMIAILSAAVLLFSLVVFPASAAEVVTSGAFETQLTTAAGNPLRENPLTINKGETVSVTVNVTQNTGVAFLRLLLYFDPTVFTYVGSTSNGLLGNGEAIQLGDNYVYFYISAGSASTSVGELFTATFRAKTACTDAQFYTGLHRDKPGNCTTGVVGGYVTFIPGTASVGIHTMQGGTCTVCGASYSHHSAYVYQGETRLGTYDTLSAALQACGSGEYVRLASNVNENLSLSQDLYVDLNGYDMSGTVNTNGYKIYCIDTTTNAYSSELVGYFSCVDAAGAAITPVRQYQSDITGQIRTYVTIQTDAGWSAHRVYMGITNSSIDPSVVGVGYIAEFYADEMVIAQLDTQQAFGFDLRLEGYKGISSRKGAAEFKTGRVTLRLNNFDAASYGETSLYAKVCLKLSDGTALESATHSLTLRSLLETINESYTSYSRDQLLALKTMIANNATMQTWSVGNID